LDKVPIDPYFQACQLEQRFATGGTRTTMGAVRQLLPRGRRP